MIVQGIHCRQSSPVLELKERGINRERKMERRREGERERSVERACAGEK